VISARGLSKTFGRVPALRDLALDVGAGECLALLGANGAGKTTLLRILATLDKPTSGQLTIAGLDALKEPQRLRAQLGLVAHQTYLHPELTVDEELRFYGRLYGVAGVERRAGEVLDQFGLTPRRGVRVAALSRGQQQRLTLARALLHDPALLLLDEPDTGLDAEGLAALERVLRAGERTIVFSSHNRDWSRAIAARAVTLTAGRLEA
jgi:ABC-type multidrug transport system ATPase subunit